MPPLQAALGPGSHCTPWQCSGGQQPAPTARLGRSEGLWTPPPHRHELAHSCRVPPVPPPNSLCAGRGPPCTALGTLAPPGTGHTPGQEDARALPAAPAPLRMHGHVPMGLEVDGTPPKYTLRPPRVGCKVLSPAVGWAPGALAPPCLVSGGMGARPAPHGHCGTGAGRVGEGARPPKSIRSCGFATVFHFGTKKK